jgi:hypothetical protein
MKVYDKPYTFITGDVLDPRDLNGVWNYKREALKDAAARRYVESVFPLSFVKDCATGYTNADTVDTRTFSFTAPADLYVTRAFLNGAFSAIGAEIKITITKNSTGTTPDGCTDPWLNVAADAPTNEEVRDYNAARFKLESGERYDVLLDSSAAFTVTRLDVHFHVLSDRFEFSSANEPSFQPIMVSEDLTTNIVSQSTNNSNFATEVAKLAQDNYAPVVFCVNNMYVQNNTTTGHQAFPLPRIGDSRAPATVVGMSLYVGSNISITGRDFTARIENNSGTPVDSVTVAMSGVTTGYASKTTSVDIDSASTGDVTTPAQDYAVRFYISSGSNLQMNGKFFITLWVK